MQAARIPELLCRIRSGARLPNCRSTWWDKDKGDRMAVSGQYAQEAGDGVCLSGAVADAGGGRERAITF